MGLALIIGLALTANAVALMAYYRMSQRNVRRSGRRTRKQVEHLQSIGGYSWADDELPTVELYQREKWRLKL